MALNVSYINETFETTMIGPKPPTERHNVHFSWRDERLFQPHARGVRVGVRSNQRVRGVRNVPQVEVLPVLGHGQELPVPQLAHVDDREERHEEKHKHFHSHKLFAHNECEIKIEYQQKGNEK